VTIVFLVASVTYVAVVMLVRTATRTTYTPLLACERTTGNWVACGLLVTVCVASAPLGALQLAVGTSSYALLNIALWPGGVILTVYQTRKAS
jgi:hypothetical protein